MTDHTPVPSAVGREPDALRERVAFEVWCTLLACDEGRHREDARQMWRADMEKVVQGQLTLDALAAADRIIAAIGAVETPREPDATQQDAEALRPEYSREEMAREMARRLPLRREPGADRLNAALREYDRLRDDLFSATWEYKAGFGEWQQGEPEPERHAKAEHAYTEARKALDAWALAHVRTLSAPQSTQPDTCSVCVGQPLKSGRKCICGGVGTEAAEMHGLREELLSWEIAAGWIPALRPDSSDKFKYFASATPTAPPSVPLSTKEDA